MYMHSGFSIDLVDIYPFNSCDYTTVEIAAGGGLTGFMEPYASFPGILRWFLLY